MHYTEFYCKILIFFLLQDTEFTQKNYGRSGSTTGGTVVRGCFLYNINKIECPVLSKQSNSFKPSGFEKKTFVS